MAGLRLDLFIKSSIYSFGILSAGLILIWVYLKGFLKLNIILVLLIALTVFDLTRVNDNHLKPESLVKEASILREFPTQPTDTFLLEDEEQFRIYPFHEFSSSRWSYYHQTIGGYHGAKLGRYQDLIEGRSGSLYAELSAGVPINWNFLNMLNVKYIIFDGRVSIPQSLVELAYIDRETNNFVYLNNGYLPRAWFVQNQEFLGDKSKIILRLNDPDFNPKQTVILESEVPPFSYNDDFEIEMLEKDIHSAKWRTVNNADAFLVISEMYYPAGWNAYINVEKTTIYPANYILRGISVPAGDNIIEMKFEPVIYKTSIILSCIGLLAAIMLTIYGLIVYYQKNYGQGIVYKIR